MSLAAERGWRYWQTTDGQGARYPPSRMGHILKGQIAIAGKGADGHDRYRERLEQNVANVFVGGVVEGTTHAFDRIDNKGEGVDLLNHGDLDFCTNRV